jgi:hypothetical protein
MLAAQFITLAAVVVVAMSAAVHLAVLVATAVAVKVQDQVLARILQVVQILGVAAVLVQMFLALVVHRLAALEL